VFINYFSDTALQAIKSSGPDDIRVWTILTVEKGLF